MKWLGSFALVLSFAVAILAVPPMLKQVRAAYTEAGYQFMIIGYGATITKSSIFNGSTPCNDARNESLNGTGYGYTHTSCRAVGFN